MNRPFKITTNYRMTIPKKLRTLLKIKTGDKALFEITITKTKEFTINFISHNKYKSLDKLARSA